MERREPLQPSPQWLAAVALPPTPAACSAFVFYRCARRSEGSPPSPTASIGSPGTSARPLVNRRVRVSIGSNLAQTR